MPLAKRELFTERYFQLYANSTVYTSKLIYDLLDRTQLKKQSAFTLQEAIQQFGCKDEFVPSLSWILNFLVENEYLVYDQSKYRFSQPEPHFPERLQELTPTYELLDFVQEHWLDIISGTKDPTRLFFGFKGALLWENYFSEKNELYHIHNEWLVDEISPSVHKNSEILELGTGLGSGSRLIVEDPLLSKNITTYFISDISPYMVRKVKRNLNSENVTIQSKVLDFNFPLISQDAAFEYCDYVISINALHCAKDIPTSLDFIYDILKPNGRLILSECIRGEGHMYPHQEFIFNLLPDYRRENLQPGEGLRGFLTESEWKEHFRDSKFGEAKVQINDGEVILGAIIEGRKTN